MSGAAQRNKKMLSDLGADKKPVIYVFNKADVIGDSLLLSGCGINSDDAVYISARTGAGIDKLIQRISEIVLSGRTRETFFIPNTELGVLSALYSCASVEAVDYGTDGAAVTAVVDAKTKGQYAEYLINN